MFRGIDTVWLWALPRDHWLYFVLSFMSPFRFGPIVVMTDEQRSSFWNLPEDRP